MTLPVLYLDNHLLVLVKPPGMLSQADRTGDTDVLTLGKALVKERFDKPGNVFLGLVQRLDRPASGVMVLARTSKAAARLAEQFRARTVGKDYVALVEGTLEGGDEWTDFLVKEDQAVRRAAEGEPGAKEARLRWAAIAGFPGATLVHVALETGRAHQVRVQFAGRGHPLVGDFRYGSGRELDGRNLALHCARLSIDHPTRGERLSWSAAPPDAWPRDAREAASRWVASMEG
jgi:RluA family pseudouridine synthase